MRYLSVIGCLVIVMMIAGCSPGKVKTGLLIIGHGSNKEVWNKTVTAIADDVMLQLRKNGDNSFAVKIAFLESKPFISDCITEFEKAGIKQVYVQPLFFTPSGHLNRDIPAILGLYYEEALLKEIAEEGITVVDHSMQITMGPPLVYGTILKDIVLTRIREISKDPEIEKLIIFSHGSAMYQEYWKKMVNDVAKYVCKKQGIANYDYAFIKVGQDFIKKGYPVLKKGIDEKKRVLVMGLFLVRNAKELISSSWDSKRKELRKLMKMDRIAFSESGILPDERVADWVVKRALEFKRCKNFKLSKLL